MAEVIRDLQNGKSVQLSYRHKIIGTLEPVQPAPTPTRRGSAQTVQNFLNQANFGPIPQKLQNSSKDFKQEIAELRQHEQSSR